MERKRHPFVTFLGGIGVGKTTAAKRIQEHLGYHPVFERYQKNHFLSLFYGDEQRWAFFSQAYFLIGKANQVVKLPAMLEKKPVVLDVAIHQDLCYVEAQRALGMISEADYKLYRSLYDKVERHMPKPDLFIYLKAPLSGMLERIQRRGRGMEGSVDTRYLAALVKAQDEWVQKNRTRFLIHSVPTNSLNFADEEEAARKLTEDVKRKLKKGGFI